ncbi:MAG: RIP metalloprotease RseP [Candidatus Sumerlaeota bacterium]|nr:RIP metalloprotease RseP [Candidatus Sumerlaeota bacterium]
MSALLSYLIGIAGAVVIFGLAILFHELGHFLLAKLNRVGVPKFAIGMGPKLVARRYGGTEYSIRALPFGGFVSIKGMLGDEGEETKAGGEGVGASPMDEGDSFHAKGTLAKVSMIAAGVGFNFLAAMLGVGLQYSVGFHEPAPFPPQVADIPESSGLYADGLRSLDRFLSVNGKPVANWDDLWKAMAGGAKGSTAPIPVEVERAGKRVALDLPPLFDSKNPKELNPAYTDAEDPKTTILAPAYPAYILAVYPNSPADRCGLKEGDWVVSINGQPVQYSYQMSRLIRANADQALDLEIRRRGEEATRHLFPVVKSNPENPKEGQLGIVSGNPNERFIREAPWVAFAKAPERTALMTAFIATMTFETLGRLFTHFQETKGEISGPVGIFAMAYKASREGFSQFLRLFVILNLAFLTVNILPLPVLDGGYIVISVIEGVTRRQIPPRFLGLILYIMTGLLILLAILITYQDILTWVLKL